MVSNQDNRRRRDDPEQHASNAGTSTRPTVLYVYEFVKTELFDAAPSDLDCSSTDEDEGEGDVVVQA